jgi:hypothetical protein
MKAHSECPFLGISASVGWVQRHLLIDPPVHGVQVAVKNKHHVTRFLESPQKKVTD